MQVAAGAELRHQVDEPVVLVHVVEFDDTRVGHAPQDLDLAPESRKTSLFLLDGLENETLRKKGRKEENIKNGGSKGG